MALVTENRWHASSCVVSGVTAKISKNLQERGQQDDSRSGGKDKIPWAKCAIETGRRMQMCPLFVVGMYVVLRDICDVGQRAASSSCWALASCSSFNEQKERRDAPFLAFPPAGREPLGFVYMGK